MRQRQLGWRQPLSPLLQPLSPKYRHPRYSPWGSLPATCPSPLLPLTCTSKNSSSLIPPSPVPPPPFPSPPRLLATRWCRCHHSALSAVSPGWVGQPAAWPRVGCRCRCTAHCHPAAPGCRSCAPHPPGLQTSSDPAPTPAGEGGGPGGQAAITLNSVGPEGAGGGQRAVTPKNGGAGGGD